MNILFVHNNFPAQYRHIATTLAQQEGTSIAAIGAPNARPLKGVKLLKYALDDPDISATHPFARRFDGECRRAEQVLYNLTTLVSGGFRPDVIMGHPGWGETLPLRSFFPEATLLLYCEFFYGDADRELSFDPEFPESGIDSKVS